MPHPAFTILFAAIVSGAICLTESRTAAELLNRANYVFLSCIVAVAAGAWIMFWIHG
jgi:hypothetical protein